MRERSWRVFLLLVLVFIGIAYVLWAANGFQPTTSLDLPFVVVAAGLLGLLFYVLWTFRDRTQESPPELRAPLP